MVLEPTEDNLKGYYIDAIINNVRVHVDCAIWYDNSKLEWLANFDVNKCMFKPDSNKDNLKFKPKPSKEVS